ncbi:MAG: hypothetical protein J5944_05315 [Lentisphaeria bacterium]|nr:hypothetical protein [Lentisphaeria bacterium]
MQNNGSVMNGLHKISGKIAEAARPQVRPVGAARTDSPSVPPAVTFRPPLPENPKPQGKSGSILGDALLRRYEDFLKTRRDLAARIARETEALRNRQEENQRESEKIRRYLANLEDFAKAVESSDESVDPGDQAVFAAECRKIEHLRLELFRISEQTEILAGKKISGEKSTDASSILPVLDSLSFGQLARAGFAFFFPVLAVLIFSALLLAAAIILSFNGMFVW